MKKNLFEKYGVWGVFKSGDSYWLPLIPTEKTKVKEFYGSTAFFDSIPDAKKLQKNWQNEPLLESMEIRKVSLPS